MLPKLKEHAFYQLTQGNVSIWSMSWCNLWNSIHDFLIPQPSDFIYPSLVRDLWQPGQRQWNRQLIFSLFQQPLATQIINIDILDDDNADILCWPLAPNGICSSKAAYKLCLQDIHTNPRTASLDVPLDLKAFLKTIWKQKDLLPKVKTFAWRMLSKALPTGMRAGRFSIHISQNCCRCAQQEDEFHLFFLCDFARAAWFSAPWFLRSDILVQGHSSMHSLLIHFASMGHPYASLHNIFNFMWCIWKARNDFLFERKFSFPYQIKIAATSLNNILQEEILSSTNIQSLQASQH